LELKLNKPISKSTLWYLINGTDANNKVRIEDMNHINIETFFLKYFNKLGNKQNIRTQAGNYLDDMLLGTTKDQQKYIEVPYGVAVPSSENQIAFCKAVAALETPPDLNTLQEIINSIYKKPEKVNIPEMLDKYAPYIKLLKSDNNAVYVTPFDKQNLQKQTMAISQNKTASWLILENLAKHRHENGLFKYKAFNQFSVNAMLCGLPVMGRLDRLILEYDHIGIITKAYIVDLKTTVNIDTFYKKYIEYGYYLQMSLYHDLVREYIKTLQTEEVEITPILVVVQNKDDYECVIPQEFTKKQFVDLGRQGGMVYKGTYVVTESYRVRGYEELLKEIKYNFETGDYQHKHSKTLGLIETGLHCIID
jgi:hypothetical protein